MSGSALQRSVFHWIDQLEGIDPTPKSVKLHATISPEEVATKYGIPAKQMAETISSKLESSESCRSLPFTLLLVCSYSLMVLSFSNSPHMHAVEESMGFDVRENANFAFSDYMGHKAMDHVASVNEFWSWLSLGFVPLVFQQSYGVAEARNVSEPWIAALAEEYPREERSMLTTYNHVVLGARLSQERSFDTDLEPAPCVVEDLAIVYDKPCVGGTPGFGGLGYETEPDPFFAKTTTDPKRVVWLYIHDDLSLVMQEIENLQKTGWLDDKTMKVEVAVPVYNGEYGIHTLLLADYFFSRGGYIWKKIIPLSTYADTHMQLASWVYQLLWLMCVLYIIAVEVMELVKLFCDVGKGKFMRAVWSEYIDFWNVVDWISVVSGLIILMLYVLNESNIATINQALADLGQMNEQENPGAYQQQGLVYVAALEEAVHVYYYFNLFLAMYPCVIVFRLFKAFKAQPRLGLVTSTFAYAAVDLAHFMLVFSSIFMLYTVAGIVLFGREVKSFTKIDRAINTCFRIMSGDFDWEEMRQVSRLDAAIWFIPFNCLLSLILLNMLLAIVMDAYTEVKGRIDSAVVDTVWGEAHKMWNEAVLQRGQLVKLADVHKAVCDLQEQPAQPLPELTSGTNSCMTGIDDVEIASVNSKKEEQPPVKDDEDILHLVTVHSLKKLFAPGQMRSTQAKDLVKAAVLEYYDKHRKDAEMDEVVNLNWKISHRMKKMKHLRQTLAKFAAQASMDYQFIVSLVAECRAELDVAKNEMAGCLPDDPDDIPLPEELLHPTFLDPAGDDGPVENSINGADEPLNVVASRKDQDENNALGEEGSTTVSDRSHHEPYERRIQDLEQELQVGRETVAELLQGVNELYQRLQRSKGERRKSADKYKLLRQRAVALTRENRTHREMFQQGQVKLKVLTSDRDEAFQQVRQIMEENKELESLIQIEEERLRRNTSQHRGATRPHR